MNYLKRTEKIKGSKLNQINQNQNTKQEIIYVKTGQKKIYRSSGAWVYGSLPFIPCFNFFLQKDMCVIVL